MILCFEWAFTMCWNDFWIDLWLSLSRLPLPTDYLGGNLIVKLSIACTWKCSFFSGSMLGQSVLSNTQLMSHLACPMSKESLVKLQWSEDGSKYVKSCSETITRNMLLKWHRCWDIYQPYVGSPFGNLTVRYGTSQFLMGRLTSFLWSFSAANG